MHLEKVEELSKVLAEVGAIRRGWFDARRVSGLACDSINLGYVLFRYP